MILFTKPCTEVTRGMPVRLALLPKPKCLTRSGSRKGIATAALPKCEQRDELGTQTGLTSGAANGLGAY